MKKVKDLLPFENILTAYVSGKESKLPSHTAEAETSLVFQQAVEVRMPSEKVTRLMDALVSELSKDSLGAIIARTAHDKQISDPVLQNGTGLTPSLIEAIKMDMVFTNSVPVKSLVKLLKMLGVGIETALDAIQVTFDKLQTEARAIGIPSTNLQPSYRKGMMRADLGKDLSGIKSDESFLYQNEEALSNYTTRLTELYNNI
jgi:hypothetical protein